jgi:hypothetical protein
MMGQEKSFEEKFPSLEGIIIFDNASKSAINKFCLDKQRVREAIERLENECRNLNNIPKGWFDGFKNELELE